MKEKTRKTNSILQLKKNYTFASIKVERFDMIATTKKNAKTRFFAIFKSKSHRTI